LDETRGSETERDDLAVLGELQSRFLGRRRGNRIGMTVDHAFPKVPVWVVEGLPRSDSINRRANSMACEPFVE
jgi:hypothetical protein